MTADIYGALDELHETKSLLEFGAENGEDVFDELYELSKRIEELEEELICPTEDSKSNRKK